VIFSGGGGSSGALSIAVVDEDGSEASRRFIDKLEKADELTVTVTGRDEAISLVRRGKRTAYVILPEGFESAQESIFEGKGIQIEVGVDPARKAESGFLQGVVTQYAFEILMDIFTDRSAMRRQVNASLDKLREDSAIGTVAANVLERFLGETDRFLVDLPEGAGFFDKSEEAAAGEASEADASWKWQPVSVEFNEISVKKEGPKTSFHITFPQSIIWMLLGCSAAFGVSLVTERTRGTLLRLRCSPVPAWKILAGKALACFATTTVGGVVLFAFFAIVFHVRPNSYSLLAAAIVFSSLAFVGVMMLISVLGKTEASAGGIGWAVLLFMAMTGGGMIPLIAMPAWMQSVSSFSFVKWTVLAVEGAVWRDFTPAEMLLPCGILLGIGAVCFGVGTSLFRWSMKE